MIRKSILYLVIVSSLLFYISPLYNSFAQDGPREDVIIDFSKFIEDENEPIEGLNIEDLEKEELEKDTIDIEKFFYYKEFFRDKPIHIISGEDKSTYMIGEQLTLEINLELGEYLLVLEKEDYDLLDEDYIFEFIVKDEGENIICPRLSLSKEEKDKLDKNISLVDFLFSNSSIDEDVKLLIENEFDKKEFTVEELMFKKFILPDGSYKISVANKDLGYLEKAYILDFTIDKSLEEAEKSLLIKFDDKKNNKALLEHKKKDKGETSKQKDLSYLIVDFSQALDKGKKTFISRDKVSEVENVDLDKRLINSKVILETKEGEELYTLGKDLQIVMEKPKGKIKIRILKEDFHLLDKDFIYEIDIEEEKGDLYLYIGMDEFLKRERSLEKLETNVSQKNENLANKYMDVDIYYPDAKGQAFKRFSQGEPIKIVVSTKFKDFDYKKMKDVKYVQLGYRTINNVFQKVSIEYKNLGDEDYKKFKDLDQIYYGDFINLSQEEIEVILKEKKFIHFSNNGRSYFQVSTDVFRDNHLSNDFEIKLTYYLHKHFYYSDDLKDNKGTISPYAYIMEALAWNEDEYNIYGYTWLDEDTIDTRTYKGTVKMDYIGEVREDYIHMYENLGKPTETYYVKRKSPINNQDEYLYSYTCQQCGGGSTQFRYYWCPSNKEKIRLSDIDMGHDYIRNQDNMQELKKEEIKISGQSFAFIKWINDNSAVLEAKTRIDNRPFFSRLDNKIEYSCCYMDNVNNYLKTYIKGNIDFTKSNLEDDESINFNLYSKNEGFLPNGFKTEEGLYPNEVCFINNQKKNVTQTKPTPIRVVWTKVDKEKDSYEYKTPIRLDGKKYYYTDEKLTGDPNISGLYRLLYDLDGETHYRLAMEKKEGYLKNEDKEFFLSKDNPEYVYDDFFALEGRINSRLYIGNKNKPLAGEEVRLVWGLDNGSLPNGEEITSNLPDKLNYNNLEWILSEDGKNYYILLKSDSEGQLTYKGSKKFYMYYDKNKDAKYSLIFNKIMETGSSSLDITFSKDNYLFDDDILFKEEVARLPETGGIGIGIFVVIGTLTLLISCWQIVRIKKS